MKLLFIKLMKGGQKIKYVNTCVCVCVFVCDQRWAEKIMG